MVSWRVWQAILHRPPQDWRCDWHAFLLFIGVGPSYLHASSGLGALLPRWARKVATTSFLSLGPSCATPPSLRPAYVDSSLHRFIASCLINFVSSLASSLRRDRNPPRSSRCGLKAIGSRDKAGAYGLRATPLGCPDLPWVATWA